MEAIVPCEKCGILIHPSVFLEFYGCCENCSEIRREYVPSNKVYETLSENKNEIVKTAVTEICNDIRDLYSKGVDFYGYSIRPSCLYRSSNIDVCSVYNSASDIKVENKESTYYKYCVSEWENFRFEGFEKTNTLLEKFLQQYLHLISSENDIDDENCISLFADMANNAIIDALKIVRGTGVLKGESIFVIVWYADSQYEVVLESAQALNTDEVYKEFASEFK